jgi:hypothetical protein
MKSTSSLLFVLGLLLALGHVTAGRVEAQVPTHQQIQNQISDLQTTVNSVQTQVNNIQSQLEQIPPAWGQTLPAVDRFVLLTRGKVVLDKETGLVWEQSPDTNTRSWVTAQIFCNNRFVGGRKGWRLPTIQELASLVDPTQSNPALPAGHPFSNVQASQSSGYWSATTSVIDPIDAWIVGLFDGGVFSLPKHATDVAWCVRGGHGGPDAQ